MPTHLISRLDLDLSENHHYRALGLNSLYGDYLIECLAEAMQEYGFDGYSFDGLYHPAINFAPYEKELYRRETGRQFPAAADLKNINYRIYLVWADDKLEQWYRRLHDRLRQVRPQAAIYTWTTNAGRYGHFLTSPRVMSTRMNMLFDCPLQEWWLDEVNLGSSVVPLFGAAYVRAVNGGRVGACEPYLMSRGNPYSTESFPPHELFVRCMGAMANGAFTPMAFMAGKKTTYAAASEIARRKPWIVRTESMPWAALLVSEQTRQFYNPDQILNAYLAHPLGIFRTAIEEHPNVTLINDWDLNLQTLSRYKVLILANSACLSTDQLQAVRRYVANGGGLVATCDTSLFDVLGQPKSDFALGDLFGVSYQGRPPKSISASQIDTNFARAIDERYWQEREGIAALRWGAGDIEISDLVNCPAMKTLITNVQATFKGPLLKTSGPRSPMKRAMIVFPNIGADSFTAAAMGKYQRGRVIYFAAGIDAAYFSYGYPYQRLLLARAIAWAADAPFPITVVAPMCIQSTFFRQKDEKGHRIIVHLFNGLNSSSDHGLPAVEVPLREEAVPVSGIRLQFTGISVKRFHLEPEEGTELTPTKNADTSTVAIPPLPVHTMLVAELE